jgi:hypothetical protein
MTVALPDVVGLGARRFDQGTCSGVATRHVVFDSGGDAGEPWVETHGYCPMSLRDRKGGLFGVEAGQVSRR